MPELPEVETVRAGLEPAMGGVRFNKVIVRRPDLRFPFPEAFAKRLAGARVEALSRRGKYLSAGLSSGETLIMHLGMSGRFTIEMDGPSEPGVFHRGAGTDERHDHVVFLMENGARVTFNDPRRFGFMDLAPTNALENSRHFKSMGPEPLGNGFSADGLSEALRGSRAPIKAALLDQRIVAGLGNIYVAEALFRAGVSPRRKAATVAGKRAQRLYPAIVEVLREAIDAGGSSLRDFAGTGGELGYFQKQFDVYDREGDPCRRCARPISRIVQGGRSTFFCGACQR